MHGKASSCIKILGFLSWCVLNTTVKCLCKKKVFFILDYFFTQGALVTCCMPTHLYRNAALCSHVHTLISVFALYPILLSLHYNHLPSSKTQHDTSEKYTRKDVPTKFKNKPKPKSPPGDRTLNTEIFRTGALAHDSLYCMDPERSEIFGDSSLTSIKIM